MAMPARCEQPISAERQNESTRPSEVRRVWPSHPPRPSAVEFALHDAQNMLALLAANVEFLALPAEPTADDSVAGDIRESTRRLGQLLNVVAALLKQP